MNLFMAFSFLCRNTVTGWKMSLSVLTTHLTTATNDETCLKTKKYRNCRTIYQNTGIYRRDKKAQENPGNTGMQRPLQLQGVYASVEMLMHLMTNQVYDNIKKIWSYKKQTTIKKQI